MGKGKKVGKQREDKFYRLAKEHGYRSRAAWKLVQIDAKFHLLSSSRAVLDLCAAPGGWMQAAVERVPVGSLVLGIDLVPIAPIRGAVSFAEDITKTECRSKIKRVMGEHGVKAFQLVLHDGSPNIGGAWAQEATSQNALVIDSLKLATQYLAPKGNFVTKVFRSQDYANVMFCLKKLFDKVEVFKPPASRDTSAEIFVVGLKYKAPAKIDPQLLDMKYLFDSSAEPKKVMDVLRGTKQKRHRDGYEDGDTTLRKECSVSDFVWSDKPLEILGTVTSMSFKDLACQPIEEHALTTEEVKFLCDDLRVLGKNDFKHLLKWRMHIRKALSPTPATAPATADAEDGIKEDKDEDEKLLDEMEELTNAMDRKKKREKRIIAKRRAKDKARKATGSQTDVMIDGYTDNELFSLATIKGKKDLMAVDSAELDEENIDMMRSDDEDNEDDEEKDGDSDMDSDEERQRYDEQMEDLLDQAYEHFMSKTGGSAKQRKRAKQAYTEDAKLLESGADDEEIQSDDQDLDNVAGDHEANPLLASLDKEVPTQEEVTMQWFSQDIFAEAVKDGDLREEMSDDEMLVPRQKVLASKPAEKIPTEKKANSTIPRHNVNPDSSKTPKPKASMDFEIVPAPETDSSDSSDSDESEMDNNTKAEILAYGKKMLRKRQREEMMDDAYNKYMFHDDKNLPKWFVEEEKKHSQPIKPITKDEIAAMKAQFKEIDARPAKKVAQAKLRKKRATMRKLEKVTKKANTISDQTDLSDRSKSKMIEQLYKKAANPRKPKKELVVAKKGVQVKTGPGKVLVDRRMKSDLRQRGMKSNKGKGKKGGKGSAKGAKGSASKGKGARAPKGGANKGQRTQGRA